MKLNVVKYFLRNNPCYQTNQKRTPIGIQIHTIGCAQGTAKSVADYWNQGGVEACVTYIVDADEEGKVLQLLDESVFTWADGGYGNKNLITIEVCESDYMRYVNGADFQITNMDKFSSDIRRGYATAVALCIDICKRYGWKPTTKLPSGLYLISSHDEGRRAGLSTAHVDPSHLWPNVGLSMDTFRKDVMKGLTGSDVSIDKTTSTAKNIYIVQTGAYSTLESAKARKTLVNVLSGLKCGVVQSGSLYLSTCGRYRSKSKANKRAKFLQSKYKIDCFVKKI